ncbi:MAG: site-2 protease family protein, partial [Micrococcales bacterium]|nr:site-2 protease family protein [Micrococcales bacterium]
MAYVGGVVIIVLGILFSIGMHEVGHMLPAKKFGVRVSQYMIGFGPTVWSKVKGETEYGLKWIPLGGYVRLVGMYPTREAVGAGAPTTWWGRAAADAREMSAEEIHPGEDHRAFYRLSVPKKLVVMFCGPLMNLLLAVVLMSVALVGLGLPTRTTTVADVPACVPTGTAAPCAPDAPASPAKAAGLRAGDKVVSWDGHEITSWDQLSETIRATSSDTAVEVVVERDGQRVRLEPLRVVQVARDADGYVVPTGSNTAVGMAGYAGIAPSEQIQRQPVWKAP